MLDIFKYISKNQTFRRCFWDFIYFYINFMNILINFVKKSFVRKEIKYKIKASKRIRALDKVKAWLLSVLNFFAKL